ncbi:MULTISPECIES: hypothetical protein [unclassified Novosphingobium]|uniref:hypothetical protein n=1 Tax=unclassified Novosphingobium TaxID=2644732 RepID=UPI0014415B37|nr:MULTISPECIES: hypothetical protein [unclassified Novosphingobium]MBB3359467.1 hypothetical protein [Novosphingobium sp. BK256]MBB3375827.1 hypothetical protein [Novosphingobium sp. BK280]MBB3380240.1 hypothetical protein [Novosphingobium sp. BK258]MBB3421934.1 hypothetical protein [Novosphingobium sp. BK267]MBB3450590.1 hypothetical protein [Novosphingobium sp. BK352]
MITRPGQTGWQTILADLALILFMICASALSVAEGPAPPAIRAQAAPLRAPPPPPAVQPVAPSLQAEPVGVWRDGPGAPPLAQWLAEQAADPRLRLSIVVRYAAGPGGREAALDQAASLARSAGQRAASARLVVEPGALPGASVTLGYDEER